MTIIPQQKGEEEPRQNLVVQKKDFDYRRFEEECRRIVAEVGDKLIDLVGLDEGKKSRDEQGEDKRMDTVRERVAQVALQWEGAEMPKWAEEREEEREEEDMEEQGKKMG